MSIQRECKLCGTMAHVDESMVGMTVKCENPDCPGFVHMVAGIGSGGYEHIHAATGRQPVDWDSRQRRALRTSAVFFGLCFLLALLGLAAMCILPGLNLVDQTAASCWIEVVIIPGGILSAVLGGFVYAFGWSQGKLPKGGIVFVSAMVICLIVTVHGFLVSVMHLPRRCVYAAGSW